MVLELQREIKARRRYILRHVRQDREHEVRVSPCRHNEPIGPVIGKFPFSQAQLHPLHETGQIIDESNSQEVRKCPQLTRGEYQHRLVGVQKIENVMLVQLAVVMNDQLHSKIVGPGLSLVGPLSQYRKLVVKFYG